MGCEKRVEDLFASLSPLFYLGTHNTKSMVKKCIDMGKAFGAVYCYNISQGLFRADSNSERNADIDPVEMLNEILAMNETPKLAHRKIFLLEYFDMLIENSDALLLTKLRLLIDSSRHNYTVVLMGRPYLTLPPILSDMPKVHEDSLNVSDVRELLKAYAQSFTREDVDKWAGALKGLTALECENILSLSLLQKRGAGIYFIEQEKTLLLHERANGLIELCRPETNLSYIGGMDVLKEWLAKRRRFLSGEKRGNGETRVPTPRGVLLTGPPGCGKSCVVSALAGSWQVTLVKLATSRLYSSLVGQTEQNMLTALETIRSLSPCILWVEEFEKFFPGLSSSASDGGVLSRVLGLFLDFLQSERDGVFVCATTNSIHELPPEIMRAGRFDAVFFVDLPNRKERESIFQVLFKKYGLGTEKGPDATLLDATANYSGAEIEQALIEVLYDNSGEKPSVFDLLRSIRDTVPVAKTMNEQIDQMREWCLWRTRSASYAEESLRKEKKKPCLTLQGSRPN